MSIPRRGFLKAGLLAAGGVATGAVGINGLRGSGAAGTGVRASATLALTADGELIVTSPTDQPHVAPIANARREEEIADDRDDPGWRSFTHALRSLHWLFSE